MQAFNSILSIDSTRIYVKTDVNLYCVENKYLLNRTIGGISSVYTYTEDKLTVLTAIACNSKRRDFSPFIDEQELYEKCNSYDTIMYKSKKWLRTSHNEVFLLY